MARRGAQASDPHVLDFAPYTADNDIAVGVAEKLVPAGTVLHRAMPSRCSTIPGRR